MATASSGSTTWSGHPSHVSPSETVATSASQYNPIYFQVCREFQRGTCSRQPSECRYAHPPDTVTVDGTDNHITVCMDFLKGKCSRESCRYFHPPPHLQTQLKAVQQRANAAAATAAVAQTQTLVGCSHCFPVLRSLLLLALFLHLFFSVEFSWRSTHHATSPSVHLCIPTDWRTSATKPHGPRFGLRSVVVVAQLFNS